MTQGSTGTFTYDVVATKVDKVGGGRETLHAHGAAGSTETVDLALGNIHSLTLDSDLTLSITGFTASVGCWFTLDFVQNGTGGWDVTWPASFDWGAAGIPAIPATAGAGFSIFGYSIDNGTTCRVAMGWSD